MAVRSYLSGVPGVLVHSRGVRVNVTCEQKLKAGHSVLSIQNIRSLN